MKYVFISLEKFLYNIGMLWETYAYLGSGRSQSNKTKPMVHKLGVTLEELYNGKVKGKNI